MVPARGVEQRLFLSGGGDVALPGKVGEVSTGLVFMAVCAVLQTPVSKPLDPVQIGLLRAVGHLPEPKHIPGNFKSLSKVHDERYLPAGLSISVSRHQPEPVTALVHQAARRSRSA